MASYQSGFLDMTHHVLNSNFHNNVYHFTIKMDTYMFVCQWPIRMAHSELFTYQNPVRLYA